MRALAVEPRLLLLDEPLAALDPQLRQAIRSDLVASCEHSGGAYLLHCSLPDGKLIRLYHHARATVGEVLPVALKPHQKVVTLPL